MNNKKNNYRWLVYLFSFMLPMVVLFVVMYREKSWPFGSASFLYGDAYDQYYAMFKELIRWLHSSDRGMLLWDRGMGVDFVLNMLYYCISPFTLIIIIMGSQRVAEAMVLVIVLKVAAMGVSSAYFFEHTSSFKGRENSGVLYRNALSVAGAAAYTLSGYVLAYNHSIMWLDALILLPLVACGVERLSDSGKYISYVLWLALAFITNFYFSFYVCIFAVIYFLLQNRKDIKELWNRGRNFIAASLLAALISGVVLVPAFFGILNVAKYDASVENISKVGSLWSFLESFYPLSPIDGDGASLYTYNSYCGALVVLVIIFYFLSRNISIKDKIKHGAAVGLLTLAANIRVLNYIIHGFSYTHGLGNRMLIILVFLLIIMAFEFLSDIDELRISTSATVILAAVILSALGLFLGKDKSDSTTYLAFWGLLVIYGALFIFRARKSIKCSTLRIWLVSLWLLEVVVNAIWTAPAKSYSTDFETSLGLEKYQKVYENLETENGERKTSLVGRSYMNMSETNWYSSMTNGAAIDSFTGMGLSHYQNIEYTYRGTTALTAMMYNVRYVLTDELGNLGGYHYVGSCSLDGEAITEEEGNINLYEADALAGMGFMLNSDITEWADSDSPAVNQNNFVKLGLGEERDIFTYVDMSSAQITCNYMELISQEGLRFEFSGNDIFSPWIALYYTATEDMDMYIWSSDTRLQALSASVNDDIVIDTNYVESSGMYHLGQVKKGDSIVVHFYSAALSSEIAVKNIAFYAFDNDAFEEIRSEITDEVLTVDSIKSNEMEAGINAQNDGICYVALPYSPGYTVSVDGIEADTVVIGSGMLGIPLTAGTHKITIKYQTPGFVTGIIYSILGILIYIALILKGCLSKNSTAPKRKI